MEKVIIHAKKGENLQSKLCLKMAEFKTKGYKIKAAGLDWFLCEKINSK